MGDTELHIDYYILGLDVGRVRDHSALSVVGRSWRMAEDKPISFYTCTDLHRFDLGEEYDAVIAQTVDSYNSLEMTGAQRLIVCDATGVGSPIVSSLRREKVRVKGIVLTGGERVTQTEENMINVPKASVVTSTVKAMQAGRLKVLESPYSKELHEELKSFGYRMDKNSGHVSYESLESKVHDDLAVALALPTWWFEEKIVQGFGGTKKSYVAKPYEPYAHL